jgi:glycosyltransferase involved in cell wall biosynthesis
MTMAPEFSIVIPCYNHGAYLRRTISSIEAITGVLYEIIIVDDGSTDGATITELKQLEQEGYHILIQQNAGPGAARNNAIRHARGKYIVPLDADDKLRPEYIYKAKEVFEQEKNVQVVYADFQRFGGNTEINKYKEYNLQDLLLTNSIGACVIYWKSIWEVAGGYDEELKKGYSWEDWDLWLNFAYHHFNFKYLNMIGYDYYYQEDSRERLFLKNKQKVNRITSRFEDKYPGFYTPAAIHENLLHQIRVSPTGMIMKILIATFAPNHYQKLVVKGKIRKYIF